MTSPVKPPIRILVADDEDAVLNAYREVFASAALSANANALRDLKAKLFGGAAHAAPSAPVFDVHCCRDAEQAVIATTAAFSEGQPFSVIFLDIRMPPGPDGVWAAIRIRECDPNADIVIATAYSDVDPRQITTQVPPEEKLFYVQKPFHPHEVRQLALALGRSQWETENRFRQLAHYDNLTGLPNRVLFLDRLAQALESAQRHQRKMAVMFLDLDNFKRINDTLGHSFGDNILKITAERLRYCVRACDNIAYPTPQGTAARLGGDEFTVVLPEIHFTEVPAIVARRILEKIAEPIPLAMQETIITPSIGIAVFPEDGENVETLLKNADLAMYFAKQTGRNSFQYYQAEMNAAALKRLTLENHLRQAIVRAEFTLHYQPQENLATGAISGVEALLRWTHEELGQVSPVDFIPVAEESGLIIAIGEWVLRTACRQAQAWRERGIPLPRIAVNVSGKQFAQKNFPTLIAQVLAETGLEPQVLEIEITESLLMQDADGAMMTLRQIKALGVQLAIDDFGTGYSSLSRLKEFPIDCLKIDGSFVRAVAMDPNDQAIAKAIIAMADSMNMRVIAEGVETSNQLDWLRSMRCDEIQGYFLSRPLPTEQAENFLLRLASPPPT
ncbi:MAG: EAL domain-containing protein [Candidatus Contendobacter sp.]|nr:EAL domain-containing protein [Candidatus Contendobacter sp.]